MTRIAALVLLSHWRRQPVQLVTLILGLALATGLWSAVQAINGQARASYAEAAEQLGTRELATLVSTTGTIPLDRYVRLRRAGWQVSPVLEGRTKLGGRWVTVMGVDVLSHPTMTWLRPETANVTPDAILTPPGRLFAHPATIAELGTVPSEVPIVQAPNVPAGIVMTDIGTAERILQRKNQISRLIILKSQPRDLPALSDVVPDLTRISPRPQDAIARLTDSFHLNLTAFGLLAFAVGLFIVHGTIGLAFQQRRPMFRSLRALGVPLALLSRLLLAELLGLALIAGSVGLVLGYLVAAALLPDVSATLRGLYGAPVSGGLALRPVWFVSGLGMALFGALVAGAQGLRNLFHLPLLVAPGQQDWLGMTLLRMPWMAAGGVMMICAGGLGSWMIGGLLGGFVLLAGLMTGAALLLPPTLTVLLAWAARLGKGAISQWFWADLRSQLPGLSLAFMALLLALSTNIGVGTMVSSFRLTFVGWLDQRLAAELYVTARTDRQGRAVEEWLAAHSQAVLPIRYAEGSVLGQPTRIYGVVDHSTYREFWPLIHATPDVWQRLADGTGALINEQLARRAELWPGDRIELTPELTTDVVGVYSDYGNPRGQVMIGLPTLLSNFDGVAHRQFGVRVPDQQADALADRLRQQFDLPASAVRNQAAIKAGSLAVFEKTFVVTAALNVLTLGVASFAILTSLLTLWTLRLPQVAPIWALGLTRRRLLWLEVLRSTALAAMTVLLAIPLGLLLAWILLAVINVEAFGWRIPLHVFPLEWLKLGALTVLAAVVAAIIPARRLLAAPPSELLKVFTNEN
ncbi:FtsX-like permease family protein [Rhodobacteraceae bacterium F11138]|nr:FtsX-like permease family protein [Rhodobacteraceae bacterium F11138]